MKTVTATVGWTKSSEDREYVSYFDGYRLGAAQHEETVTFEVPDDYDDERVGWLLMEATNSPYVDLSTQGPAGDAFRAIAATGYTGRQAHFSLSQGDTVTVNGVKRAFTGYALEVVG